MERVKVLLNLGLVEAMVYQVCLAHPSRGNECHVVTIDGKFHQLLGFFHSVAEILGSSIAFCHKWIVHTLFILSTKV